MLNGVRLNRCGEVVASGFEESEFEHRPQPRVHLLESTIRPPIGQHLRPGEAKDEVLTIIDGTNVTADVEALVPG
jgi:hypothetical protein